MIKDMHQKSMAKITLNGESLEQCSQNQKHDKDILCQFSFNTVF